MNHTWISFKSEFKSDFSRKKGRKIIARSNELFSNISTGNISFSIIFYFILKNIRESLLSHDSSLWILGLVNTVNWRQLVGLERSLHRYVGPFNRLQRAKEAAEPRESIRQLSPVGFSLHHGSQGTRTLRASHSWRAYFRESLSTDSKSRSGEKEDFSRPKINRFQEDSSRKNRIW